MAEGPDCGISYNQAPGALQKLVNKVAKLKKARGEESDRSKNGLPQVAFSRGEFIPKRSPLFTSSEVSDKAKRVLGKIASKPAGGSMLRQQFRDILAWSGKRNPKLGIRVAGVELISQTLDELINFEGDPRPRNSLGEFVPPQEGGPDRNAIATTYGSAQQQQRSTGGGGVTRDIATAVAAAPLVGAGGTAGGLAVKELFKKLNARKALRQSILKA